MNGKILELMELENRHTVAKEEKKAADEKEDATRRAYDERLRGMIDNGEVKVDQVYMIDGKAVIFRKKHYNDDHGRSRSCYRYSFEVLPVM